MLDDDAFWEEAQVETAEARHFGSAPAQPSAAPAAAVEQEPDMDGSFLAAVDALEAEHRASQQAAPAAPAAMLPSTCPCSPTTAMPAPAPSREPSDAPFASAAASAPSWILIPAQEGLARARMTSAR